MTTLNGPTNFANDGKDVLETSIELNDELIGQLYPLKEDLEQLSATFDIDATANLIIQNKDTYTRVIYLFIYIYYYLNNSVIPFTKYIYLKLNSNCNILIYKKVSLQFPDEILFLSSTITKVLKSKIDEKVPENNIHLYVLADTSYGSCCVDEVAAEHVDSNLIIHYGHTCLSR